MVDKSIKNYVEEVQTNGYAIVEGVFSSNEIEAIRKEIERESDSSKETFRKSKDLFAIRQFLKEIHSVEKLLFNATLKNILENFFDKNYFVVKSIYFDKPEESNWFVAYHQDLTISVDKKVEIEGFSNWTIKQNQFSVQPNKEILKNIVTIRIHLDDTNEENGALKIIPKSHEEGIVRLDTFDFKNHKEISCNVRKGGIMIMKPLLFHASNKTTNKERRRVIHLEFSKSNLPKELSWSEQHSIN
ncbi:phytanoyl-CoA dioxygenase family protein [Flavobacterium jejuense]|uniref:Phytanoyl-CoA dioxygenase family protein n=1 Tax=Flavobacterium jejuense TaxID=1544455 RepID=A0ABX0ISD8_9FLAO|nr:phytanoyl-CoA dioxygenase family protein [Flavobacterium jejuense]NHN25714.1 phytanoyl-CoA dioxygenase family protein [Flavobacterium jejuense]